MTCRVIGNDFVADLEADRVAVSGSASGDTCYVLESGKKYIWSGTSWMLAAMQSGSVTMLFSLAGANMQSTADQAFTRIGSFVSYVPIKIIARRMTGGATVTCIGGIYTGPGKTGNALVPAVQSWINLTGAGKVVDAGLGGIISTDEQTATPILSLTTGSTGAATADFAIYGIVTA